MRRNTAFTLIELLVVIAIIAILAAILFPVFAQARAKARQTACLSNLKQLNLGFQMYIQDYDETFPYWSWGQSYSGASTATSPNATITPNHFESLWINAIYPYVKNNQVYACPQDVGNLTPANSSVFWWSSGDLIADGINPTLVNQNLSYGMSEPLEQGSLFGSNGTGSKLAGIQKPAETFVLADMITLLSAGPYGNGNFPDPSNPNDPQHNCIIRRIAYANQNDGTWSGDCTTALPAWDSGSRHSAGGEIGFADGHVKFLRNTRITNDLYRGDGR
jgi:prepilin-type N-terminal cleavage/methylation domain-containing protein/prepilin-type processing-associated H-X9-DG protein